MGEQYILTFIKNNRLRVLLELFRKYSAILTVAAVTILVTAGNARSGENGNFLYGFFKESENNQTKIQKRIALKQEENDQDITTSVLGATIGEITEEDDRAALMLDEESLIKNQTQYQVLTATTPPDPKELISSGSDVAVYEVKSGDTLSTIAKDFNITVNTIMWANDIESADEIKPKDKIFILPITGVRHKIKSGDNVGSIAKKYNADKDKIIAFNNLSADGSLKEGDEIIIPEGKITESVNNRSNNTQNQPTDNLIVQIPDNTSRVASIIDRAPKSAGSHRFPYGYCTWYVAQKKYVPWGGNAGTWLYNAKAYGAKTGKTPKAGSIIVTSESWYGHVGIVTKVSGEKVTIKEMNYAGFAKESSRTISAKNKVIKGYIY